MSYDIALAHTIDAAHRVVGHEGGRGKCARLHGHTYTFRVEISATRLEPIGFVLDYAVIKDLLNEWDHRTLLWDQDPLVIHQLGHPLTPEHDGVVRLPFNPTAENLARYIAEGLADLVAAGDAMVAQVVVECRETAKSMARYTEDRVSFTRRRGGK